jgi:4-carboxymuconolactone decarboxylase
VYKGAHRAGIKAEVPVETISLKEITMDVSKSVGVILLAGAIGVLAGGRIHAQNAATADSGTALPKDVYADSRNRLSLPKREDMSDADKKVFDELTTGDRLPPGAKAPVRLYSPKLAKPLSDAHHYLKFESGLGDRLTTIAVLVTAWELDSQFEWTQWELRGRKAGSPHVDQSIIDVIKYNKPVTGLAEKDAVIITFGRELFGQKKVSSETFAQGLRLFGPRGMVDLTNLMALYTQTALELTAFDQQLWEGQKPLLPPR